MVLRTRTAALDTYICAMPVKQRYCAAALMANSVAFSGDADRGWLVSLYQRLSLRSKKIIPLRVTTTIVG